MKIGGEGPRYEPLPLSVAPAPASGAVAAGPAGPSFASVLKGVGRAIDAGEARLSHAQHGGFGGLDNAQLIALQIQVYQYSEAVDLVAKLADRATNAVKTVVSPH